MTDLSKTIAPKSDQLNADDLIGGPITVTVRDVSGSGDPQQPISIYYEGDNGKPYKPCKSMRRVMVKAWGADGKGYAGKRLTLYTDPTVKFGGIEVGGIRISHMSHIPGELKIALTVSKSQRKPYLVRVLQGGDPPQSKAPDPEAKASAIRQAKDAARGGMQAFTDWFQGPEGREIRHLFKDDKIEMDAIKLICTDADKAAQTLPTDPFDDDGPTEEQRAAAETAAREAAEQQEREAMGEQS